MYRQIISDGMKSALTKRPEIQVYAEHIYENAIHAVNTYKPDAVMLEIPESKAMLPENYLQILDEIRKVYPRCKFMLMCPDSSEVSKRAMVEAMCAGRIDDYVFYNVTMDYLLSKLDTLSRGYSTQNNEVGAVS